MGVHVCEHKVRTTLIPVDGCIVGDSVGTVMAAVEIGIFVVVVLRVGTVVPGTFNCAEVGVDMVGTGLMAVTAGVGTAVIAVTAGVGTAVIAGVGTAVIAVTARVGTADFDGVGATLVAIAGVGIAVVDIRVSVGVVPKVKEMTSSHTGQETDILIDS